MTTRMGSNKTESDTISTHRVAIDVWKHLVRKDFYNVPKKSHRGQNINEYVKPVRSNCEAIGAAEDDQRYILINNLDDVPFELFVLSDTKWIEHTLTLLHKVKTTEITPLHELLKIKLADYQHVADFATNLRVKALALK